MKKYFFLAVLFFGASLVHAQIYEQTIVHAGDDLSAYFTYRFPSFDTAAVKFKNGGALLSKMNYNTLLCKMQFISDKGDTLELLKLDDIDSIYLKQSVFYYNKGSYEMLAASDSVKLVVFRKASYETVKTGAMGTPAHGTSTDSYSLFLSTVGGSKQLLLNEDVYVKREIIYYLINHNGEMFKANKSNFLKIFTGNKKGLEDFIKANKLNLDHIDDLRKLFQFCISGGAIGK